MEPEPKENRNLFGLIKNLRLVAVVVLITLLAVLLVNLFKNPLERPQVKIDLSRQSVVKEIQDLGRLETASYNIEKIIEAGQEGNIIQNLLFGDKLILIANGKVVAGVDLLEIQEDDVRVDGKNITINLPAPIILNSVLDSSKTKVYDRDQGYLSQGNKDLETEARKQAEISIREAACGSGILEEARVNAIKRMQELFKFAGFDKIQVNIPSGSC